MKGFVSKKKLLSSQSTSRTILNPEKESIYSLVSDEEAHIPRTRGRVMVIDASR